MSATEVDQGRAPGHDAHLDGPCYECGLEAQWREQNARAVQSARESEQRWLLDIGDDDLMFCVLGKAHDRDCPIVRGAVTMAENEMHELNHVDVFRGFTTARWPNLVNRREAQRWLNAGAHEGSGHATRCRVCAPDLLEPPPEPRSARRARSLLGWPEPDGRPSRAKIAAGGCC